MPKVAEKDSKRSKRRANRGFVNLETSSRKHRRAKRRMQNVVGGKQLQPGEKYQPGPQDFVFTGPGALKYH